MTPEQRYESLARSIMAGSRAAQIGEGKGFGSTGQLKVDGKIFAMLVKGKLVVKLPGERVDVLVESGEGERFDAGKGKPMREWFVLSPTSSKPWLALAQEAMAKVSPPSAAVRGARASARANPAKLKGGRRTSA
jgi:TfoX/Sxy family transcriptional regulator of competence genes